MEKVLVKGLCVNPGFVSGRSKIVNSTDDVDDVSYGDVIVLPNSDPKYAVAVLKASAVICENGGRLSHICIVTMEMGIPCITQATAARSLIPDQTNIFVDATNGEVLLKQATE